MADQDAATPPGAAGIPDLNDPSHRYDRNAAMDAMRKRRRETVMADMEPADAAAFAAQPLADAPASVTGVIADEDTDSADAEAARVRAALEASDGSLPAAGLATAPAIEPEPSQLERQRNEPVRLSDDDLRQQRITMKVNGVETEVSVSDLLATAQKVAAADEYLATAKELLTSTKAAATRPTDPATPSTAAAAPTTAPANDPADGFVKALFQGDEARATEFARQLVGTPAAAAVDPNRIASDVERTLVIRSALKEFAKDHRAITSDPVARQLADQFLGAEIAKRGATTLHELSADQIPEAFSAAGRQTMDFVRRMAGLSPSTTPQVAATLDARRAEKAKLDEPPTASTRAASTAPAPRNIIAEMQAARQPQAQPPRR